MHFPNEALMLLPDEVMNFEKWKSLRESKIFVYGWRRNENNYLYIGQTRNGLHRIMYHDIIDVRESFLEKDELVFWFSSEEKLDSLERFLIAKFRPKYNIVYSNKIRSEIIEEKIFRTNNLGKLEKLKKDLEWIRKLENRGESKRYKRNYSTNF